MKSLQIIISLLFVSSLFAKDVEVKKITNFEKILLEEKLFQPGWVNGRPL